MDGSSDLKRPKCKCPKPALYCLSSRDSQKKTKNDWLAIREGALNSYL